MCMCVHIGSTFGDKVLLCDPGLLETCYVEQNGLKLKYLPALPSQVLELKVCSTISNLEGILYIKQNFWLSDTD